MTFARALVAFVVMRCSYRAWRSRTGTKSRAPSCARKRARRSIPTTRSITRKSAPSIRRIAITATRRRCHACMPARALPSCASNDRTPTGLGTGFLFYSPKHVLTAFHVIDLGRDLFVKFASGRRLSATVVATDTDHDLAILELEKPVYDTPILSAHTDLEIGMRVLAIGNPYGDSGEPGTQLEGLLNCSSSQGTVSAFSSDMFQTDALLAPGNSGGPIFACDGGVVGVADLLLDNRIGFAVRIHCALRLATRIYDRKGPFRGTISLRDPTIALLAESVTRRIFSAWVSVVASSPSTASRSTDASARCSSCPARHKRSRGIALGRARHHRAHDRLSGIALSVFVSDVPHAVGRRRGVRRSRKPTQHHHHVRRSELSQRAANCVPKLGSVSNDIRGSGVLPMASLHVTFASFDVGYAFKLDVIHPNVSTQRIWVGLVF